MKKFTGVIIILAVFSLVASQLYPGSYEVSRNIISESGSSATGNCSNVTDSGRVCNRPHSSILFDGIPTLTELDGDMWARQLLTFNTSTSPASITFNFTTTSDRNGPTIYTGVQTIEVVMFNCPIRGIGTNNFIVSDEVTTIKSKTLDTTLMNCSYLARICVDLTTTSTIVILTFQNIYQRIYVAEVSFYSNPNRCSMAGPILSSVIIANVTGPTIETTNSIPSSVIPATTANIITTTTSTTTCIVNIESSFGYSSGVVAAASIISFLFGIVLGILGILLLCMIYLKLKNKSGFNKDANNDVNMENISSAIPETVVYEDIKETSRDVELQQNDAYGKL